MTWFAVPAHAAGDPGPTDLVVDGQASQLAASLRPAFGWLPHSATSNDIQSAYDIVIRDASTGSVVWDSGEVRSSDESYVTYGGPKLTPGRQYAWTVQTWNRAGRESAPATAYFDTGLGDHDWSGAQWIRRITTGHDSIIDYTLAREEFDVGDSPVRRARAYVAAEGEWQLHVNGQTVDTQYDYAMPGEGYYTAEDITPYVTTGPLALGVKYAATATTDGGSRPEGPVPYATTLSTAAPAGATTLALASTLGYLARENLAVGTPGSPTFDIVTIQAVNASAVTLTRPLLHAHVANEPVVSENGPTGLLVKVVVEHTDGTVQTFVSDGGWRVTKDASELNDAVTLRSAENAGTYVERIDARQALTGWDSVGYDADAWHAAAPMGRHPLPNPAICANYLGASSPCGFTHLNPMRSKLVSRIVHPISVTTLHGGTVTADFGAAIVGVPRVRLTNGVAGRPVTLLASYRLANSVLTAPAAPHVSVIDVASPCRFQPGDPITVDGPADGYGAGDPEHRTVASVSSAPKCASGAVTLDTPLQRAHPTGRWVEGARAGTSSLDTQATDLSFHYIETAGAQTTPFFVGQGFRFLQIAGAHEPLTTDQIWVDATHEDAPPDQAATFHTSNPTLNAVFDLMKRSALYAGQQQFNDSPDRQDGQFLGDAVDESFATMESLGERALTRQAIVDFAYSQQRYWSQQAPGFRSPYGDLNAVYPTGDGKRDIPDFTEMYPEWVRRYYWLTGDRHTLRDAYPTMQRVARYVGDSIATSGGAKGLVYQLIGGSNGAYRYGIVDWPQPMRYDTTVLNAGVDTVVNLRAVEVFHALAETAAALGYADDAATYQHKAQALTDMINKKLLEPSGYYDDGLSPDTNAQLGNHSEHDQTFAVTYGVAPASSYEQLGSFVAAQGMKQGPMDLGQLEQALVATGQTGALVDLLTNAKADGPAKILAEGGTSMWEQWDPGCMAPGGHPGDSTATCVGSAIVQSSHDSFSHGWGSVGVVGILRGLLGVTVTGPGAATVAITPPASGLAAASGAVWTERGPVSVDWRRDTSGYAVTVDIPDNMTATVTIPGKAPVTVGSGRTTFPAG
ncbi:MAG: alpha-L-rhamnosidase N-terminal domain-containing protein [Actinomycetes bacterium]